MVIADVRNDQLLTFSGNGVKGHIEVIKGQVLYIPYETWVSGSFEQVWWSKPFICYRNSILKMLTKWGQRSLGDNLCTPHLRLLVALVTKYELKSVNQVMQEMANCYCNPSLLFSENTTLFGILKILTKWGQRSHRGHWRSFCANHIQIFGQWFL